MGIARTPVPPYYVAVITVERTASDDGYFEQADAMYELAKGQPGFLDMQWVYDTGQQTGITSSYWTIPKRSPPGSSRPTTSWLSAWARSGGTGPIRSASRASSATIAGRLEPVATDRMP
jgi:hypothetical protein